MRKSAGVGVACLLILFAALAHGADSSGRNRAARRATAICEHFQAEAAHFRSRGERPAERGARELCFESCAPDQVPASQFWSSLDTPESRAIRDELLEYVDDTTVVTEVDMKGGASRQFRLARVVGTARCQRDTYLERTPAGFRRIRSSMLDLFSEEAAYCGPGEIYFSSHQGSPYAINTYLNRFEAFRIGRAYKLTKTCSVPADDRFSYAETGPPPLPRRLEKALRFSESFGASRCKLTGKKIRLRTGARFYLASTMDGCETRHSDFGEPIGKIWILTDKARPKIIFSGEAIALFVQGETSNGLARLLTQLGHRDWSWWAFDGQRFVEHP